MLSKNIAIIYIVLVIILSSVVLSQNFDSPGLAGISLVFLLAFMSAILVIGNFFVLQSKNQKSHLWSVLASVFFFCGFFFFISPDGGNYHLVLFGEVPHSMAGFVRYLSATFFIAFFVTLAWGALYSRRDKK